MGRAFDFVFFDGHIYNDIHINIFLLGDSRNYMPPILVLSPAKRIATQILVIANLNGKKILRVFVIFVAARNCLFKVRNLSTIIMCESCSILIMTMLTIFSISDINGVVLVSLLLKLVSAIFCQFLIFSPNHSPSKTMKSVFYFM